MSDDRPTPLIDLRVVEISDRIAGSYCGKLLVDAGADVRESRAAAGGSVAPLHRHRSACRPEAPTHRCSVTSTPGKRSMTTACR